MININKSKEYGYLEAWEFAIDHPKAIITSKKANRSYKIDMLSKKHKLRFYNPVIKNWQVCSWIETEEIFDSWYITKEFKEDAI